MIEKYLKVEGYEIYKMFFWILCSYYNYLF